MFEGIDAIARILPLFMLVFARITAMLSTLPVFSMQSVPGRIRVMLAMVFSVLISLPLAEKYSIDLPSVWSLIPLVGSEVLIGLLIGLGARILFECFSIAGSFISLQIGMAMMSVVDPATNQQQPIISQFLYMLILIYFVAADGHHLLLETLYRNFDLVLPGAAVFQAEAGRILLRESTLLYDFALRLAAPALVFLILVDLSLAFVTRMMPQMNIFFISLPLKIFSGLVILVLTLNIVQLLFGYFMQQLAFYINALLKVI